MQDAGYRDVGRTPAPAVRAPSRPRSPNYGVIGFKASASAIPHIGAPRQSSGPRVNYAPQQARPVPYYSSGKSVGSSNTGRISPIAPPPPAPPPPPKPPSIDQWLAGDTVYKQQTDASAKALADYMAQMTGQQNSYNTEYQRNLGNLSDAEKLAQTDTENDYASRGLSTSGVFLKALADLKADYDKRESTLSDGRAEFLSNLANGLTNFRSTQGINNTRYRNEAINRRAAQFGL